VTQGEISGPRRGWPCVENCVPAARNVEQRLRGAGNEVLDVRPPGQLRNDRLEGTADRPSREAVERHGVDRSACWTDVVDDEPLDLRDREGEFADLRQVFARWFRGNSLMRRARARVRSRRCRTAESRPTAEGFRAGHVDGRIGRVNLRHLGLPVTDSGRSLEFYTTYFEFDPSTATGYTDGTTIIRNADGFDLALHPVPKPPARVDFLHFGFRLVDPGQVHELRERMEADGVSIVGRDDEPDLVSFKCLDPDGWRIEIYWERT